MGSVEELQNINAASFRAIAQSFDRTRQGPWKEIMPFVQDVRDGDVILDLGCGNGRLLNALPPVNFSYLGVDNNEYLLSQARKAWPARAFRHMSFEGMTFEPDAYHKIFFIASFHHIPGVNERVRVLKICRESLNDGGSLLLTVWNLWQLRYIKCILKNWRLKVDWNDFFIPWKESFATVWRYYHGFTRAELRRLLTRAGFSRIEFLPPVVIGTRRRKNFVVRAYK